MVFVIRLHLHFEIPMRCVDNNPRHFMGAALQLYIYSFRCISIWTCGPCILVCTCTSRFISSHWWDPHSEGQEGQATVVAYLVAYNVAFPISEKRHYRRNGPTSPFIVEWVCRFGRHESTVDRSEVIRLDEKIIHRSDRWQKALERERGSTIWSWSILRLKICFWRPGMHWEWCNIVRRHCWDTSIPPGFDLYVLPSRDRPESGPPADISKYEPELAWVGCWRVLV